jgi:DNA-binding transcriptional MerR regulator
MKRRGNRRYYQHHEVLMIRRIRDLLYDQGFTISGARNKLQELASADRGKATVGEDDPPTAFVDGIVMGDDLSDQGLVDLGRSALPANVLRTELLAIRQLLTLG